jgi:hypothetical protein
MAELVGSPSALGKGALFGGAPAAAAGFCKHSNDLLPATV